MQDFSTKEWKGMGRTHTKPVVVVEVVVVVTDRTARVDRSAPPPEGDKLIIQQTETIHE